MTEKTKTPAQMGWQAFREGAKQGENPHPFQSRAYKQWLNGWVRACKGYNEPKAELVK